MNIFRTVCAARVLGLALPLGLPTMLQAQFEYTNNNGAITITGYTGPGGAVNIPSTIEGLPVTAIGNRAFDDLHNLTSVTVPGTVATIGSLAFNFCFGLNSATISNGVASIGDSAFNYCSNLTRVAIPDSVTNIAADAFSNCENLTRVTIGNGVMYVGIGAFGGCANLQSLYFQGNAPSLGQAPFSGDDNATVYYRSGTSGWGAMFGQLPTMLWDARIETSGGSFGVWTNQFGFTIAGTSNLVAVVEACTNLANPDWFPVQTNTLSGGSSYFTDFQWTNYPSRFYRLSIPTP